MSDIHMRPMTSTESNLMTQVLTVRRQLGAVRRLHQQYRPAFGDSDVCGHCTRGMDLVYWPCPTIQAIEAAAAALSVVPDSQEEKP